MQAYGDPAMRSYGDLDLLVRQRDIRRATELMIAAGYEPAVSLSAIDAGKIPGQYLFSHPHSNLLVELHNDLTLRYFPRRLPLEDFFARQIRVPLDGREAPALAVEDELVLICIHGAKHFWERLMWIADVAALVTRQTAIDWKRVADSARAVGAERMLHTGLRLASDLLNAQLPGEVLATVQADGVAARLAEANLQAAARRGQCASRPVRTRRVSNAHAWQYAFCSCLSASAFFFAHGRRLARKRRRPSPKSSRHASPPVSPGAKIRPRR